MSNIYVYSANCEDFTNFGLVGALTPISCFFEEEANGMSEITMEHPIDAFGKYTQLVCNNLLMVDVPVRTTPEIDGGNIVTAVEKWTVRTASTITKAQRTLYKKASGSRKIKVVPAGTEVTVVKKSDEGRYKVKCRYGTGWMNPDGLLFSTNQIIADNSQSIESVQPAWSVKPQLFRIYKVEKGILGLTVSARHISYDLLYNLTTYKNTGETTCINALAAIMDNCVAEHDFEAFTNIESIRTGINWTRTNPIDALLNPETGLTAMYGASLVRDNWEMYVLHDPGLNRGVTVEYGKNMTGIKYTESFEDVVTRVIPVGETKDGDDLLLTGETPWVDSPHINEYPVVYAQELKCENCKVGTDGVTTAIARARMLEQARAVFDNGGDIPVVEMSVDFVNLGDTAEYAQFKNLERLFLWDYVIVRHKLHGIDVTSRIVSIKWDCLLDRMDSMDVGSVGKTLANSGITTWQIPTGFSGSKIAGGTVGSGALQSDIIAARHIQSESINTEALQAGSITSEKIAAGAITAEKLEADIIDAVSIEAIVAHIDKIVSDNITTDKLYTALAEINSAVIKYADVDMEHVKDFTADEAIISRGVGGQIFISRLAVTEGNMVSLTVGELVVKGEDGCFYAVSVDDDGNIKTTLKQVSNDDVKDLSLNAGEKIIEGTVTAACLNATDIFAENALIKQLMAANIDVDTLMAREAFINLLRTSQIVGGKSITMIAEDAAAAMNAAKNTAKTFRQESAPGVAEGVKSGDIWVKPSTGAIYQADAVGFSIDENGVLYLEHISGDGYVARIAVDDPYSLEVNFDISVAPDGTISGTPVNWNLVQDKSLVDMVGSITEEMLQENEELREAIFNADSTAQNAGQQAAGAVKALGEIPIYVNVEDKALVIRDIEGASVLRAHSGSISIGTTAGEAKGFSQFAANYVQFGNYQIRRASKGGLVFKMV